MANVNNEGKIRRSSAILALVGGQISGSSDGSDTIYHDGQTPPLKADIDAKVISMQAEYDSLAYSRARQAEYPNYGTQLNKIYDDGLAKWKTEMVDPIKAKYPKP